MAVLLLAACESNARIDTSSPQTSSSSASASPTLATDSPSPSAEAAVVAQYKAYWKLEANSFNYASSTWPARYAKVAVDPLLANALTNLGKMKVAGEELYGAPVISDVTARINGAIANVHACVDSTKYGRKRSDSGKILSVGVAVFNDATLKLGKDGIWRVSAYRGTGETCSSG